MFQRGDTVAERYEILRFVGRGGMGEVYEALDLDLEVNVALKTVRPEIADHDTALERFRREIQLARKVTHPNVCRIFDVGHHHIDATAIEDEREIVFLTMEHLHGSTLARRIEEEGSLDEKTALPIVEQMAAAIDAAHNVGIIHRDFKSSNVMLVEDSSYPGGVRAVVTDFGLARGILPGDSLTTSLSSSSQALGTPTYMAPEQVAGAAVGEAVDIYALGIVVYEMMTGRPPFQSSSPLTTAVKRLTELPPPPRSLVPGLSSRWESGILRCLERDPAARFAEARDLVRWIERKPVSTASSSGGATRKLIISIALVLIALSAAGLFLWSRRDAVGAAIRTSDASPRRPLAAVIGFRNLTASDDVAWVATALQEMLSMELAASEEVRVVPGDIVARARLELGIDNVDSLTTEQMNRIAGNLGADIVLLGTYFVEEDVQDPEIRIDVRAHRRGATEVVSPVIETGKRSELLALVSRTGSLLRNKLGYDNGDADTTTALAASYPVDPRATMLYATGLQALRDGDPIGARQSLEESIQIEPRNPLAYSALASAWSSLGYDTRARDAARRAMELSEGLPRQERLLIDGRYREAASQWDEAVATYSRLWKIAPDNLEYGLALARAQSHAGDPMALETISAIRAAAQNADDPRIALAEAAAAEVLGDFATEREAARTAANQARQQGATVLLARAKLAEWWAERNMGNLSAASTVSQEALEIARQSGDRSLVARALNAIATTKRQIGQTAEAKELDLESLDVFRDIGDKRRQSWALNNLGRAAFEEGAFGDALEYYQSSLRLAREIDDSAGVSRALGNIGNLYFEQGRLTESERVFRENYEIARAAGDRRSLPWAYANLGGTIAEMGKTDEGMRMLEEAISGFRESGERRGEGWALMRHGELQAYSGAAAEGVTTLREALRIFVEIGDRRGTYWARMRLAEALYLLGRHEEADGELDEALGAQTAAGDRHGEALNHLWQGRIALADERPKEALEHAAAALDLFRALEIDAGESETLILEARTQLAAGDLVAARKAVEAARANAIGMTNPRLELRMAIVEDQLRLAEGGGSRTRERIEAAGRRASSMGFEDLARLAKDLER